MKMKVICIMMCLILIANILPVSGLMAVSETKEEEVVAVSGENDWPMYRNNPENTGFSSSAAPSRKTVRWSRTIFGEGMDSSPVVVNGKLYVTTQDGKIHCYNANRGRKLWDYDGYGDWYMTSPAVVNNKVYFGSYGDEKYLYCLDADTGSLIWERPYDILSSLTIVNGDIFFGNFAGEVLCVDAETGSLEWTYETGNEEDHIYSTPAVANGKVYAASLAAIYCLDAANGQELWNYNTAASKIYESPVVFDDKVYVSNDNIYCLDANSGDLEWSYSDDQDEFSCVSVAYGKVYFGNGYYSSGNNFYCLDASSGELVWEKSIGSSTFSSVVADNKVYIGTTSGYIYCLNSDSGDQIWKKITGAFSDLRFAIADGDLFAVVGCSGKIDIICFGSKLKNIDRSAGGLLNDHLMERMLHFFQFLLDELKPYQ